ncbi:helix-turn-helix DNA-binding domain protein [Gordonia phage Nedarya]|nr:helix-turn-helix DNA-binding domain protein [Gordonia phage Nedarya]
MTATDEYGPENPRDWTTDDRGLTVRGMLKAPHETAGVLRMQRNGIKGADIMRILRARGTDIAEQLKDAMEAESDAAEAGVPIHDPIITEEKL